MKRVLSVASFPSAVVLAALLLACAGRDRTAPVAAPAPVATPTPVATPAAPPSPDEILALSHRFLEATDGNDAAATAPLLARDFIRFEGQRFYNREQLLAMLAGRAAQPYSRVVERALAREQVRVFPGAAIYSGVVRTRLEPAPGATAVDRERWLHLFWIQEDGHWKLAHAGVEAGGREAQAEKWNRVFREGAGFETAANRFLADVTRGRKPGTALDVGMGQGRNALYLAAHGWKVTGIDIADEGLRQAREAAAQKGLTLDAQHADIATFDWGADRWDLVALIYVGGRELAEPIKRSLKPGGIVVVEFFHDAGLEGTGVNGFRTGELAKLFEGYRILRDEVVEDVADYGQRKMKLVRFAAQKP